MLKLTPITAIAATIWLIVAIPAIAGKTGEEKIDEQAKAAFNAGVKHYNAQRYEEANTAFRRANELKPSWKLLYNIGQCEASLKHYDLALTTFERYLAEGGDEIPEDRQKELLAEVARLRQMVGFLEIHGREGDVIVVDGVERGALPEAAKLRISMGKVQVQVVRDGILVLERQVEVFGEDTVTLQVDKKEEILEPSSTPEVKQVDESKPVSEDVGPEKKRVWTWVAFSIAGAAGIVAGVTGGLAIQKRSDVDSQCTDGLCPSELKDDEEQVYNLALTTDILIGAAVLGVGTGILLYFFEVGGSENSEVAVVPTVGDGGAGLVIRGRF